MALTIYKPGQGYWTRVMSAIGFGTIALSSVAWSWGLMETIGSNKTLTYSYADLATAVQAWARPANHPAASLTAVKDVKVVQGAQGVPSEITLADAAAGKSYTLTPDQFADAVNTAAAKPKEGVKPAGFTAPVTHVNSGDIQSAQVRDGELKVTVVSMAARNRLYIQAGVAVGMLAVYGAIFLWVFNKPAVVDFFIATESEMKKVNWPSRKEIVGATWIVICGTFLMALLLLVIDAGFAWLFTKIGILEGLS